MNLQIHGSADPPTAWPATSSGQRGNFQWPQRICNGVEMAIGRHNDICSQLGGHDDERRLRGALAASSKTI